VRASAIAAGAGGWVETVESAETGAGTDLNVGPGDFFHLFLADDGVDSGFLKTAN
jgi:hypothetical protein